MKLLNGVARWGKSRNSPLHCLITDIIRGAVNITWLETTTGQQQSKPVAIDGTLDS